MNKKVILISIIAGFATVACGGIIGVLLATNNNNTTTKQIENTKEVQGSKEIINGWKAKNDSWYYYKDNVTQAEWLQDNGKWYYLGNDGKMRTGWIKNTDKWYYFNSDGTMAINTTVDGCYLNEKGLIEETPVNQSKPKVSQSKPKSSVLSVDEAKNLVMQEDYDYITKKLKDGVNVAYCGNADYYVENFHEMSDRGTYLFLLEGTDGVYAGYIVNPYNSKVYKGPSNGISFLNLIKNGQIIERHNCS